MAMTLELLNVRLQVLEKQIVDLNITKPNSKTYRISGWTLFQTDNRDLVKQRLNMGTDEKIKATDVMKELAVMWKALGDDERTEWNTKANEMKKSHELNKQDEINHKIDFTDKVDAELVAEEIDPEAVKPDKCKKDKKDKPKKKRVSGYILFQKAMRDDVVTTLKEALVEEDIKIKQSDVMSELGKMWKALDDEEREQWNDKAAEQKASDSEE